jgi:riboflavin kinase/FMN adenylyltransferase
MLLITDIENLKQNISESIITLGNFDGLHLGHQALIRMVRERAKETSRTSMVVTFRPHPLKILHPDKCPPLISIYEEKIRLIEELGVDVLVKIPFTLDFAKMEPEAFVREILCRKLGAREIFVGDNYRFGRGRAGNIEMLRKLGDECGFIVRDVEQIALDGEAISSTKIRQLLRDGEVEKAARLLGRDYAITGVVIRGDGRGRQLGFPTANIAPKHAIIPSNGVYAVRLAVRDNCYTGIANIGMRPTFDKKTLSIEAYIFNFDEDIYGEEISAYFLKKIREEKKFSGIDELIAQIREDIRAARQVHLDASA